MRFTLTIIVLCIILAGCRTGIELGNLPITKTGNAAQYGFNERRTNKTHAKLEFPLKLAWQESLSSGKGTSEITLLGDIVFIPTLLQGIDIYNIRNGEELGWITFSGAVLGAPAIKDSLIYIPVTSGNISLLGLDINNGSVRLQNGEEPVELPVLITSQHIVTIGMFRTIVCYRVGDTTEVWTKKLPKPAYAAPASSDSVLFVSCTNGDVYALNLNDGSEIWRFPTGAAIHVSPIVSDAGILVANREGLLFLLDKFSGAVLWQREFGIPLFTAPAADDSMLFLTGTDGTIRACNIKDGQDIWVSDLENSIGSSPVIADSYVITVTLNGNLVALDKNNGNIIWNAETNSRIRTSPIVADGVIAVITDNEEILGFMPEPK